MMIARNITRLGKQYHARLPVRYLCAEASKQTVEKHPKTIFSGIQPTGSMHLGNYLGAIRNWVALQDDSNSTKLYSIVDLHSITVPQPPRVLRQSIHTMAVSLLACGVDPERSIIFQQSEVACHAEMTWILSCLTPVGNLNRMHQWKSKHGASRDNMHLGLYSYPVLMAADILLYRASHIPIGEDQLQHLELARDLARLFNASYGQFFTPPKPILATVKRVMSLRDPSKKMSKSDPNKLSRIELKDTPEEIRTKIKKSVTDSKPHIGYDPSNRPGLSNLIDIYVDLSGKTQEDILSKYAGLEHCKLLFKEDLTELVIQTLQPIRLEILRLDEDQGCVDGVLRSGADKAHELACETMARVKKLVGLR